MSERSEDWDIVLSIHFIYSSYRAIFFLDEKAGFNVDTWTLKNAELSTKLQNTLYYGEFLVVVDTESMILIFLEIAVNTFWQITTHKFFFLQQRRIIVPRK